MLYPKSSIIRDRKYLDWVRTQPCVLTGRVGDDVDPAHIRYHCFSGSMKPGDDLVLSLAHDLHMEQHNGCGEVSFWCEHLPKNPDLLMKALKAYAREQYQEYLKQK